MLAIAVALFAAATSVVGDSCANPVPGNELVLERKPNAADLDRAYPPRTEMPDGAAYLACSVSSSGRLGRCVVERETPAGAGFGEAALKLTPKFRYAPKTRSGHPIGGRCVRFSIHWQLG